MSDQTLTRLAGISAIVLIVLYFWGCAPKTPVIRYIPPEQTLELQP